MRRWIKRLLGVDMLERRIAFLEREIYPHRLKDRLRHPHQAVDAAMRPGPPGRARGTDVVDPLEQDRMRSGRDDYSGAA